MVQRRIVDEANIFYQYHSCLAIMELINRAELTKTVSFVGPFYPQLICELIVNLPIKFVDPSAAKF